MRITGAAVRAVVGVAIGAVSMYFAIRGVPITSVLSLAQDIKYRWIAVGFCLYGAALGLRTLRWQLLVATMAPIARWKIGEALVVGFAFNNVLPARLGELVRADYLKSRFGLNRSAVLGSIVVERLHDGLFVVLLFYFGLAFLAPGEVASSGSAAELLPDVVAVGGGVMAAVAIGAIFIARYGSRLSHRLPPALERRFMDLIRGLGSFDARVRGQVIALTIVIWLVESAVFWCIARSVRASLSAPEAFVLAGAASLSTLVPTAPGFLGSYQYVFALCMELFGLPREAGILAATLIQIFLFGAVTVAGLVVYALHHLQKLSEIRNV